jgi:SAM-dependent methyltransferase
MLRRQRHEWQRMAQTALHWSCLPDDRFLAKAFADNEAAFSASGRMDSKSVQNVLSRHRISTNRLHHLVDFGCGAGRGTIHLAALCPEVSGVDISAPHLKHARFGAKARMMDHIRWLRSSPARPMPATDYDVWFSRATLQYCAPPVSREILIQAFRGLRPGGVAIFQLLVYGEDYRFRLSDHLASKRSDPLQLHVLPQAEVFALASAAGLIILEMHENVVAGVDRRRWASVLIAARRPE